MKKEYKKCCGLLYCYDPNSDSIVRVYKDGSDIVTYSFKLSDWDTTEIYDECTKKEFKTALSAAIKKLMEVTK